MCIRDRKPSWTGSAVRAADCAAASWPSQPRHTSVYSWDRHLLVPGVTGDGKEDVIQIWGVDRESLDLDRVSGEPIEQGLQRPDTAVVRNLQLESVVAAGHCAEAAGGRLQSAHIGELQSDVTAGDQRLQLAGSALRDQLPLVEDCDPVGELVGLLQVLGLSLIHIS